MADEPTLHSFTGGCQCGAVRYSARLESLDAYFCHCRMCQRAFGNVLATYVNLPKRNVSWMGTLTHYASSLIARRGFCGLCGTPLSFEYNESPRMDLSVGSLDEPGRLKPTTHVGIESRVASFAWKDDLLQKRLTEFEHIGAKWRAAYGEGVVPGEEAARGGPRPSSPRMADES